MIPGAAQYPRGILGGDFMRRSERAGMAGRRPQISLAKPPMLGFDLTRG